MRYIIAPLDLTTEQREIYFLLYSKMDFNSFTVKYTLNQLVLDSNPKLELTKKKISKIIKDFITDGLLKEIRKGVRGNPTLYEVLKIKEQIGNKYETNKEPIGTNREQINVDITKIEPHQGTNKELIGTNREQIGNKKVTPINDKDKEKDNNIYTDAKQIFDYWNESKAGITHNDKTFSKNKIKINTAIKKYGKDEILKCIKRLSLAVNKKDYYYSNKWNIMNFFKQSNGINNWQDEGQLWNQFKSKNNIETETNKIKKDSNSENLTDEGIPIGIFD